MFDPTLLQQYEMAREQIRHEDGLINNRTTWLLVFQGLLFGAFFQALGLFEGTKLPNAIYSHKLLMIALCIVCLLGVFSALVAGCAIDAAHNQIKIIREWWKSKAANGNLFPEIMGTAGTPIISGSMSGGTFVSALSLVWGGFFILLLLGAWR